MGDSIIPVINIYFKESSNLYGAVYPVVSNYVRNDRGTFYILDREVLITPNIDRDIRTNLGAIIGIYDFDETSKSGAPCTTKKTALFFDASYDPMSIPIPWSRLILAFTLFIMLLGVYMHYNVKKEIYDI